MSKKAPMITNQIKHSLRKCPFADKEEINKMAVKNFEL